MKPLIDALRTLGSDIRCTGVEGFFPIEIHARGLCGGPVSIDASESSQLLSALLMVAPHAAAPIEITLVGGVRWPFVAMTINQMAQFGFAQKLTRTGDTLAIPAGRYAPPATYAIEPDATASSYFTALPLAAGGTTHIANLLPPAHGLQGDSQFLNVLTRLGAEVAPFNGDVDITVRPGSVLRGVTQNFSEFSDTFLTLAALAPLLAGPTTITGIAHSRKQETDRVAGMVAELRKLGQDVHEHEDQDGLSITPDLAELRRRSAAAPITIETYGDHRFAMSFAILGCHDLHGDSRPWLSIRNPACCAKTFPHFFELLETLRKNSLAP